MNRAASKQPRYPRARSDVEHRDGRLRNEMQGSDTASAAEAPWH